MRVLNIGSDRTLVGGKGLGDAVARHREYGSYLDSLDIIVYTNKAEQLEKYKISDKVTGYPTNSKSKMTFFWDAFRIAEQVYHDGHKFDIIVAQDPFLPALLGLRLKKKFGVKLQINFHGDFWANYYWLQERWYNFLFLLISKYTVPRADAIRVMGSGQKEKLLRAGIPTEKVRVISTPVDLERFENFQANSEQKQLFNHLRPGIGGHKMILMVGRRDEAKGVGTLIAAVNLVHKENPEAGLWLVGGGYSAEEVRKLGLSDEVRLIMTGSAGVDAVDLPIYYDLAYMVVLPSTSESFGKVLVEANACGKPVVATATTGAKEIVEDGVNGFLVPIGDSQALAEKTLLLLRNPELAQRMGDNGRRIVREKFGDNTAKIIGLWKELAQK